MVLFTPLCRERIITEDCHNIEFDMIIRNPSNIAPYPPLHHDGEENSPIAEYFCLCLIYLRAILACTLRNKSKIQKAPVWFPCTKLSNVQLRCRGNPPPPPVLFRIIFLQANNERKFEAAHCLVKFSVKGEAPGGIPNRKEEIDKIYPAIFQ